MSSYFFSSKPQQISESASSIAKKIYGDLSLIKILVVGDNKISFSILDLMRINGVVDYLLLKGEDEKKKFLVDAFKYFRDFDIIITSFRSDKILISKSQIISSLKNRKQKPLFFIDTNIPGNIDSDISKIDNCFLYDLNDLEQFYNDMFLKLESKNLPETEEDFQDILDVLIPKLSEKLMLESEQNYLLEEKIKSFFKSNSSINEKVGILNFFEFFIKK